MNRFDKITKHFVLILIFCMTFLSSCCGPNPAVKAAEGDTHWARSTVIASNESRYNAITTDISGNIYAAGKIHGTGEFEFGNGATVTALTSIDLLLVKYNSNGNTQWAKSLVAASHNSEYTSVATDNNGNVYAIGYTL